MIKIVEVPELNAGLLASLHQFEPVFLQDPLNCLLGDITNDVLLGIMVESVVYLHLLLSCRPLFV